MEEHIHPYSPLDAPGLDLVWLCAYQIDRGCQDGVRITVDDDIHGVVDQQIARIACKTVTDEKHTIVLFPTENWL